MYEIDAGAVKGIDALRRHELFDIVVSHALNRLARPSFFL
jgi:hypothetical protein